MNPKRDKKTPSPFTTTVQSCRASHESRWLALVVVCVLLVCSSAISLRTGQQVEKQITGWQINAFTELNGNETAVFSALETAALEINDTHDLEGGQWMGISQLEEMYIPPFVRDSSWQKQGKIIWSMKDLHSNSLDIATYMGTPGDDSIGGTFLLVLLHDHQPKQGQAGDEPKHPAYEIWFHKNRSQENPDIITDQALTSTGWREVVALTGQDEAVRIKGRKL